MLEHVYRFGNFSISPTERCLYEQEGELAIPPKCFDALLLLVRHQGALVTRNQITRNLWPDTHVSEANLTNIIVLLRKLLGRDAIQTVSKFGYRFTLPVTGEPDVLQSTYATFIKARELAADRSPESLVHARELFWICLANAPSFALGWAWLGRTCRLLEKFGGKLPATEGLAEAAFTRAFLIDPDLACAHQFYTQFQVDAGQAHKAMVRLSTRIRQHGEDPECLTGLVQVLRCCGLLDDSIAAHHRAVALDPLSKTSVAHTHFLKCEYTKVFETYTGFRFYLDAASWAGLGEIKHAIQLLRPRLEEKNLSVWMSGMMASLLAALEGRSDQVLNILASLEELHEPEGLFYFARHGAMINALSPTIHLLQRARASGFLAPYSLQHDPVFDPLRQHPEFQEELEQVRSQANQSDHWATLNLHNESTLPHQTLSL